MAMSCTNKRSLKQVAKPFQLVTLDPGHFHAALVQKTMYTNIDSVVHVYAPQTVDLDWHLDRINAYNNRKQDPTRWKEEIYTGADFFEKMIAEKKGNIVVLSGNNEKKSTYILQSLENGFNVLADKPMAINSKGFEDVKRSFDTAAKKNLLLYDIMTERFEITTLLQRELLMMPEIFGTLEKGTTADPSVVKQSVHYLYKYVSGNVLTRPYWFLDASKQGDGLVDVMTHLVDLVQWESFPNQTIDYSKDIQIATAKHWSTNISLNEFKTITKLDSFPSLFKKNIIHDSVWKVYCNGEINYQLRDIHAKTTAVWKYKAPEGTGDTYFSLMKGTKAKLIIAQGVEENYQPTLYIKPVLNNAAYENKLLSAFKVIQSKYSGVALKKIKDGWQIMVPGKYKEVHEQHFAHVTQKFLEYLQNKKMPDWEVPNMIAKYYTTTKALEIALKNKP